MQQSQDISEVKKSMQNNEIKGLATIAFKLLIICSIVAIIIASVNFVTKDKIALNERMSTAVALSEIYGFNFGVEDDAFVARNDNNDVLASCKSVKSGANSDIREIYEFKSSDKIAGYCVFATPMGFKSNINMLIAIKPNLSIQEIKIISLSETSGIGTKIMNFDFLQSFVDKTYPVYESVDIISGATKSSKPVIIAADKALSAVAEYISSKEAV